MQTFFDKRAEELGQYNDELTLNGYKGTQQSSYWSKEVQERLFEDIVSKLELLREHRVLDVGCGTGMILRRIAPHVAHVTGIDFSAEMLKVAFQNAPPNATLRQADAAFLPLDDQTFDRVLCYHVISNFLDDNFTLSVLAQLVRVTRKGGIVLIGRVPDIDRANEQAQMSQRLHGKTSSPQSTSLLNRMLNRARNIWLYRIRRSPPPNMGFRFYSRDFFNQFAKRMSCQIEILPLNIEGDIYAPYRFDVRLKPIDQGVETR